MLLTHLPTWVRCTTPERTHTHTKEEEEIGRSEGLLLVNVAFKASVPFGLSLRGGKLLKEFRQWPWRRGPLHFLESIHKLLRRHIAPIHLLFFTPPLPPPKLPQQKHNLTIGVLLDPQQKFEIFRKKKSTKFFLHTSTTAATDPAKNNTEKNDFDRSEKRALSLSLSLVVRSRAHNLAFSSPCTLSWLGLGQSIHPIYEVFIHYGCTLAEVLIRKIHHTKIFQGRFSFKHIIMSEI